MVSAIQQSLLTITRRLSHITTPYIIGYCARGAHAMGAKLMDA